MNRYLHGMASVISRALACADIHAIPLPRLKPGQCRICDAGLRNYLQADDYACGYIAVMSVAHTLRPPSTMAQAWTSARRLWRTMKPDTRTGISQAGIMRGLKSLGIHASMRRNLTFGEIRRLVDGGCPVITAVRTRTPDVHHWTVIHGYSVNPGRIYLSNTLLVRGLAQAQHWPEFRRKVWADPGYGIVCRR